MGRTRRQPRHESGHRYAVRGVPGAPDHERAGADLFCVHLPRGVAGAGRFHAGDGQIPWLPPDRTDALQGLPERGTGQVIGWWKTWKALEARGIMGINRRNADYVLKYNKRSLYPIVDDKIITKERAIAAGIHVPEMYGVISTEKEIDQLDEIIGGRSDFVIKPAQGAGGDGILVIADRFEDRYRTVSGRIISKSEIEHQVSSILTGLYSLGGHRDRALIEYRVTPDPIFKSISYEGVPDIRIIVLMGYPVMAMLRLPTRQSGGKANLHQGAIGVGVDLATGITLQGTWLNSIISKHPDTTNSVDGVQLPNWDGFMKLSAECYELCGLGYIGVDMVLDQDKGPLILELNARPGLNIQIANDSGLTHRTQAVEARIEQLALEGRQETPQERVEFVQALFGHVPGA
ncbi:Uncharacterized protein ALO47_04484 [Pseudomonas syringae pv. ribicola]|uniref:ATP-grasp domain-containing protein n=2 Tax=Pseudomonas syringae group TaxID=136849 RepID=A0A0N8SP98_PSESI|nr:Uncharacterized protein ALO47_04484 [Pseudomonas syringae pv. ribicola]